ncbi:2562_t:CDS:2 [Acaulospora morrowiae]|uniref:Copper transport protein n=1 Tax=Acaulospora morrowiae TaxID=94023 RepID=A0A9N9DR61_9GLOM|nr:2562_t:CDS:2 [Acaulospora morrowiae]
MSSNSTDHDHGGHGGDGEFTCSNSMLFNWEYRNLCIVFSWWGVNSIPGLILSCAIICILAITFEVLRFVSRKYDEKIYLSGHRPLEEETANASTSTNTGNSRPVRITHIQQIMRSLIYSIQVLLSFFLMLMFMTYNGFVMISVVIGAGIGYFFFGRHVLTKVEVGERDVIGCH